MLTLLAILILIGLAFAAGLVLCAWLVFVWTLWDGRRQ